jgi:tripartite-type tricarboxylate transporter receptor subunit TctC
MLNWNSAAGVAFGLAAIAGIALSTGPAWADDYPSRPITMLVGYGAGGSTDLAARIVAQHMEKTLGQPITIENRTGGNGLVATNATYNAKPDGYTITMTSGSILTVMPWNIKLAFDPLKLSFIGSTHESLYALFVKADAPWKTIDDYVAYAKANPNQVITANSGGFGLPDIGMAQLANAVGGMQYRTVPTTGGGEQVLKLLAGDVHSELNSMAPTAPHFRSGALRALLVVSPQWPELEEKGVPLSSKKYGFSVRNLSVVAGPPGLPEPIRAKLESALKAAMDDPEVMKRLQDSVGEDIRFRTGAEALKDAQEVQAQQRIVGEQLGKLAK